MEFYKRKKGECPSGQKQSDENVFHGDGWSVYKDNNKYYLRYVSGALQGELKSQEITSDEFKKAKEGQLSLDDFCIRYGIN